ncbi:hypothetical protein QO034_07950 [Sedimentitalea sp. JM2-8]|uniref:Invasion protein IalB, involved in pathogenesis n=1 Tax=Sedimentitalea xiamensis TaxID=3050037 RepID=A0ABT7FD38_9RHOB|nr:hypothetical protein [Sedimentitalea xiamensis]MDK3073036.1 hypothetical protein [Sedimentitalea xiamensis]
MSFPNWAVPAVLAGLLSSSAAFAQVAVAPGSDGFEPYGASGDWNVFIDRERKSCLIERVGEDSIVQMGLTADHAFGYIGVFSSRDTGIKRGEKEDIFIDIDGVIFQSQATGMKGNITEGFSGGYILANNPAFIDAVANGSSMIVFPETDGMFTVDLEGTKKAMEMARACNLEQAG